MNFEELLNRLSPKLKAIARRLNARFRFFDEDDLYQEAAINLWIKYTEGKLADKTDSYILQGSFFFLKNYIRVAWRKTDAGSVSIYQDVEEGKPLGDTLTAGSEEGEFAFMVVDVLVEDILTCLSEREKEVFLLSLEEMTTREIGARLGVSHVAVVKIEKRIREKCRCFREEHSNNERLPQ